MMCTDSCTRLPGPQERSEMAEMSSIARGLMEQLQKQEKKDWSFKEIQDFIITLISHCYDYNSETEIKSTVEIQLKRRTALYSCD